MNLIPSVGICFLLLVSLSTVSTVVYAQTQTNSSAATDLGPSAQFVVQLDKLGIDVKWANGEYTIVSTERETLLQRLTLIQENLSGQTRTNVALNSSAGFFQIKGQLAALGAVPVWDGKRWSDERWTATLSNSLPSEAAYTLAQLNFWDRNSGGVKPASNTVESGESTAMCTNLRNELASMGVHVIFDSKMQIWRAQAGNK